jgi:hypothetical protein
MLLFRQIGVLVWKNILIGLIRRPLTTPARALILPILYVWFLSMAPAHSSLALPPPPLFHSPR